MTTPPVALPGIVALSFVLLLLTPPVGASAPSTSTVLRPPYAGVSTFVVADKVHSGCASAHITRPPTANASTGVGALGAALTATRCGALSNTSIAVSNDELAWSLPLNLTSGPHRFVIGLTIRVLYNWSELLGTCTTSPNVSFCDQGAVAQIDAWATLEQNGTAGNSSFPSHTWLLPWLGHYVEDYCAAGSCATQTLGIARTNDAGTLTLAVRIYLNHTLLAGDRYVLSVALGDNALAAEQTSYATLPTGHASFYQRTTVRVTSISIA